MNEILKNRPMSGFPVAIGTSLALETVFNPIQSVYDEARIIPKKIEPTDYSVHLFNISTLLRNIISSLPTSSVYTTSKQDYLSVLLEEIEWLTNFYQLNQLDIQFYINDYQYVKDTYADKDKLRKPTTDKQIYLDNVISYCLSKLKMEDDVKVFHNEIRYNRTDKALMLTHVPWDLLSHSHFDTLHLLESHTGLVKSRKNWNTKYLKLGDRDMSFLPFLEYLLVTFGDSIMFIPSSMEERVKLYEHMVKKNVTPLTSEVSLLMMLK